MRFSIGHRLFASVLLSILVVLATSTALVLDSAMEDFDHYAGEIELERLEGLSASIAGQYRARGDWSFLPAASAARAGWVVAELARLGSAAPAAPALSLPFLPLPPPPRRRLLRCRQTRRRPAICRWSAR